MKDTFVLNGKWWTPATPQHVTEGEMTFDPSKGAILKLSGMLEESETCAMPFEIVLGETETGVAVTMIGSSGIWLARPYRAADAGEADIPVCSTLCANVLLVGKHFLSPREIDFYGFYIDLSHLRDWADLDDTDGASSSRRDAIEPAGDLGSLGRLTIEPEDGGSCHLALRFDEAVGLDKGIDLVRQLRNLMALLMHRSVQVLSVSAVIGPEPGQVHPGMMVDVFYPSFAHDRSASPLQPEDMLLPLSSIGTDLGNIVARWFSANESMPQVLDLYFAASQSAELFPETRFLMYVQALEAYHRFRYRNFEVDPKEHAERLATILASIPEQYREWMRDGLEHSNEPSHGQRLKEIYRDLSSIMDEFVDDKKRFIYQVVKTRNQMMHLEGDSMVLEGSDLALATTRLRLLLELCLLKEIGISQEMMGQAATSNTMFARIKVKTDGGDPKAAVSP